MRIARLSLLTTLVLGLSVLTARADTFGFTCVTDPQSDCGGIEDQFLVDVTSVGGGTQVQFHFTNNVGTASSITDIYFDDTAPPSLAEPMLLGESAGVDFEQGASPGNLPGGGTFSASFSADSEPPTAPNGINSAAEFLNITFSLASGATFQSVIQALSLGTLSIGLHVQAIGPTGTSSSWVNGPPGGGPPPPPPPPAPIPEPATMLMLGSGLAGLAAKVRRDRQNR